MNTDQLLLRTIDRNQFVMRTVDVERLLEPDHPARLFWEAVGRLDLKLFYKDIGSTTTVGGRPTYPPQLLISVWVYALSRGIGSAREIDRRCDYDPAFQWLTAMKGINYHTLADFRVDKKEELDQLFSHVLGVMSAAGLVTLEQVMVDGTKIKAQASGKSFRREKTLREHLKQAREQVKALSDPHAEGLNPGQQKARERAQREKQERLELALEEMKKLQEQKSGTEEKEEVRVSMTDPEARRMKQSDGGYAPNYNAQICTDGAHGIIVDVEVTQAGNDFQQLLPALERVEERLQQLPQQMVADGGYTSRENIEKMAEREVDFLGSLGDQASKANGHQNRFPINLFMYDEEQNCFICPAGKQLSYEGKHDRDGQTSYKYKAQKQDCQQCPLKMQCCPTNEKNGRSVVRREETAALVAFRAKMATAEAKAQYRRRSQIAEFPHAWIKVKLGLRQFHLRGRVKGKTELMWAALTFNLQKWIRCLQQKLLPARMVMG
jgi:transposase